MVRMAVGIAEVRAAMPGGAWGGLAGENATDATGATGRRGAPLRRSGFRAWHDLGLAGYALGQGRSWLPSGTVSNGSYQAK